MGMDGRIKQINTAAAPSVIGPYSQGVVVNKTDGILFVSGQLPIDPATGQMLKGDIYLLTNKVIDNLEAILLSAGAGIEQVVKVDVFMVDLSTDYSGMNEVYAKRFTSKVPPARLAVEVQALPKGARIEMSCVAYLEER